VTHRCGGSRERGLYGLRPLLSVLGTIGRSCGVERQSVARRKDVAGRYPEGACCLYRRYLGLLVQTECGEADRRQRQDGV
jgi:hypothetical protein